MVRYALLLIVLGATAANAQIQRVGQLYPVGKKEIKVIKPDFIAVLSADGKRAGPWQRVRQSGNGVEAASWKMAWDSSNTNTSTFLAFTNFYGASAGPQRLSWTQKNFMWCNDITAMNTGTAGQFAKRVMVGVVWNPNGTDPGTGTANAMFKVYTANSFDDTAFGPAFKNSLGGVIVRKDGLAAGMYAIDLDMETINASIALPLGAGSVIVEAGTKDGANNFLELSGVMCAQPLLGNMCSAGEPQFPGTNPSKSSDAQWDDDSDPNFPAVNRPDYIFQDFTNTAGPNAYAEFYGYDATLDGLGILQGATGLFIDQNARKLSGTITFGDISDPANGPSRAIFQIKDLSNGQVISVQTVAVSPTGAYTIMDPKPLTGGNYEIYCKATHWLQKVVARNTVTTPNPTTVHFTLLNGDIDRDNFVTLLDYDYFSASYDKTSSDIDWEQVDLNGIAPRDSDLDEDGLVTLLDYDYFSANYDFSGDAP